MGKTSIFYQPHDCGRGALRSVDCDFSLAWAWRRVTGPWVRLTEGNPRQGSRGEHFPDNGWSRRSARWPASVLEKWVSSLGKVQAMAVRLAAGDFRGDCKPLFSSSDEVFSA